MASNQDQMEGMADRESLFFSAVLLIAAIVVIVVATLFHPDNPLSPCVCVTPIDVFTAYANSTNWTLIHEGQFVGSTISIFGLLALFFGLNVASGIRGMLNRFAAASAVAALALDGAVYAVDGVALKQAVDAWVSAPASQQAAFFAVVQGIRGIEWGFRAYADFATGLSLVLFAIVIASTRRIPRPIGYLMGLSGLAYIGMGYNTGSSYTSISSAPSTIFDAILRNEATFVLLVSAWTIWLLISAYRMKPSFKDS